MWNMRGVNSVVRVNMWGLCEEKLSFLLTFISGISNVFKICWIKEVRIVEEMHDKIKAMMEELMSKFDEMISGQGVLSRKENEVEMPSIKAIVNDENMGDNSKEKKDDDDVVDYDRESQMQQSLMYESWPMRIMGGGSWLTNIFVQGRTFKEHNGLDDNLGGIKLKIQGFQGNNDLEAYLDWEKKLSLYLITIDI